MDLRPSIGQIVDVLGVPATVTPPAGTPVSTRVVWLGPHTTDVPAGFEHRREKQHTLVIPTDDALPTVPRLTVVAVAGPPGPLASVGEWVVDATVAVEDDSVRVLVVPSGE